MSCSFVTLPYDPYDFGKALTWARNHCPSYNTYSVCAHVKMETDPGDRQVDIDRITYYFDEEKDAILFALRWS